MLIFRIEPANWVEKTFWTICLRTKDFRLMNDYYKWSGPNFFLLSICYSLRKAFLWVGKPQWLYFNLIDCLADWLIDRWIDLLIDWFIYWEIDWPLKLLMAWFVDWLFQARLLTVPVQLSLKFEKRLLKVAIIKTSWAGSTCHHWKWGTKHKTSMS